MKSQPMSCPLSSERLWRGINPSAMSIGLILATILLAFQFRWTLNIGVFILCQCAVLLHRPTKTYGKFLLLLLFVGVSLFFTGYYYHSPDSLGLSADYWQNSALQTGLLLSSRALAFGGLGMVFAFLQDRVACIQSYEQQLHLPRTFAYSVMAAWSILPKMRDEYAKVRLALQARGVRISPFSLQVLKIMLVKTVRWSDYLAMAMISKGFTDRGPRTNWVIFRWTFWDIAFLIGLPAILLITLFV